MLSERNSNTNRKVADLNKTVNGRLLQAIGAKFKTGYDSASVLNIFVGKRKYTISYISSAL